MKKNYTFHPLNLFYSFTVVVVFLFALNLQEDYVSGIMLGIVASLIFPVFQEVKEDKKPE